MALSIGIVFILFVIKPENIKYLFSSRGNNTLNSSIIETIREYPTDGTHVQIHGKEVNTSMGTTKDLYYMGKCQIKGDPKKRCHCIGLIFEVYLSSCEKYAKDKYGKSLYMLPGVNNDNFSQFRSEFYGVNGNKKTFVDALSFRKIGKEIFDLNDAQPGDMIQFWRHNGTGHAAVFLSADKDNMGCFQKLRFWSVHASGGISEKEENIGDYKNAIDIKRIYIIRPYTPFPPD